MKPRLMIWVAGLALAATALTARAGEPAATTNAPAPVVASEPLDTTNIAPVLTPEQLTRIEHLNQIRRGRIVYCGSVIQAIKTGNPLQLINPFAPVEAGSGADNTVIDPISGRGVGLKLVAVSH